MRRHDASSFRALLESDDDDDNVIDLDRYRRGLPQITGERLRLLLKVIERRSMTEYDAIDARWTKEAMRKFAFPGYYDAATFSTPPDPIHSLYYDFSPYIGARFERLEAGSETLFDRQAAQRLVGMTAGILAMLEKRVDEGEKFLERWGELRQSVPSIEDTPTEAERHMVDVIELMDDMWSFFMAVDNLGRIPGSVEELRGFGHR